MLSAAFAALLAVSPILAAGAEPAPPAVTEADFLTALDEDHPAFLALDEAIGLARAGVIRAETLESPELEWFRETPSGATEQVDLTVAWQPPRRGHRRRSIAAAESALAAARAGVAADRLDVRRTLRQAFAEWTLAVARARRLDAHVERLTALAERERRRAERGEASGLGARRLELAAGEATSRLALAEAAAARARSAVGIWRPDLPAEAVPVLPELPDVLPATPAEPPRLRSLAAELEAARLSQEAAQRWLRWPELVAGWQRQETEGESAEGLVLGLSWSLPVADRRRAERRRSRSRVEAAEARLDLARRQAEADLSGATAAYQRLAAAAAAATPRDLEPLVEAAATAFRYGEASLTDLLETVRGALEAELAALELHGAALAAHRDLEIASGRALTPDPRTKTP